MKPTYTALVPFGIFLFVFTLLNIVYHGQNVAHDNFAIFAAMIAIIVAFFTFQKDASLNEKVDVFIQGSRQAIVMHMCYIFYVSTVFTTILEQTGGITAAVAICLFFIPIWCILPGLFLMTSLFSFTVGTSMGAIAAFMPIAVKIAHHVNLDPSLMAATIVCGAIFGDNLSILSDTTISAVKITESSMQKKLLLNTKIALPAFIGSCIILMYQNYTYAEKFVSAPVEVFDMMNIIKIIPYLATFYLAFTGLDILVVLAIGIAIAISIALSCDTITFLQAINYMFDGFYSNKGMVNVFILVFLLSGLSNIMTHNGGIHYLMEKLSSKIKNRFHAKLAIFLLVSIINIMIAINTIAILITGPIAKKIGSEFDIPSHETACILDIGSCISQGILPYAPQLLLAASMAHVSSVSLLPYLYYQYLLGITLLITLLYKKHTPAKA